MNFKTLVAHSIIWRGFYFFSVLLVNVFLSRYLKAAGAGNLYFITVVFSFAQTLFGLSFDSGITFFGSGKIIPRNKLISVAGLWSIVAGLAMVSAVYIYFLVESTTANARLSSYSLYGFCYVTGQLLMTYLTSLYYTKENYFLPNVLLSLVNFAFILIIPPKDAPTSSEEIHRIITLYFLSFLVAGIVLFVSFIVTDREQGKVGFPGKEQSRQFLKYSFTALAANVIFFLVYRIDYLFVKVSPVCTDADLGNYIQVSKLGQMMLLIPQIIASVVFPRTASGIDRKRLNYSIMVIARLFSQFFLAILLVILVCGRWLFILLFGETFNKMQAPFVLLIPGIFFLSVQVLLAAYFGGKGHVKVNVISALLALVVMIVGDYFFVPLYGIIAAAIVSTISYGVNVGYSLYVFYKDYSVNIIDFFRWRKEDYFWLKALTKSNTN
jgi:O-antigen/teichoic acid export membrane protein